MPSDEQRFSPENEPLSIRLDKIRQCMKRAAEKSGRDVSSICLVAVTKTIEPPVINKILDLNILDIAENKVQEAQNKRHNLQIRGIPVRHHLIGNLQTNKVRKALELFDVIQTVDRPRVADAIDRIAAEMNKLVPCLVEIKMGDESTKTGIPFSEAADFIQKFSRYKQILLSGLMMIAPLNLSESDLRDCFRTVKMFFDQHRKLFTEAPILSMGMSDDYEMAVEEGSTMIRLGRALFGERLT